LQAVSHNLGAHTDALNDVTSDEDESGDNIDFQSAAASSTASSTTSSSAAKLTGSESSDSSPAVNSMSDLCEVCKMQNRTPVAFVPCGHARFCTSCTDRLVAMGSACPVCRSRIDMVLRLFKFFGPSKSSPANSVTSVHIAT